ncbi:MAG: hypothetical protein JSW27_24440, partial [Phycisphaerales bacterium]
MKSVRFVRAPVAGVFFCAGHGYWVDTALSQSFALTEEVASIPPMGWNSFDAYDCAIDERQFRAVVDYLAAHLLEYGWEYAVIDYIWFNPAPGNWDNPQRRFGHPDLRVDDQGRPTDKLTMDRYGRLLPAVERFPSAADGRGFKPLADYTMYPPYHAGEIEMIRRSIGQCGRPMVLSLSCGEA